MNYYQNGEDLRFKPITHDEERELFRKAKSGDQESREFLIRNHLLFVAKYGIKKAKGCFETDEVVSAMNAALMSAIDRFNPDYKNRFRRYLLPFLAGAMSDLWKSRNPVDVPTPKKDENGQFVGTSEQFVAFPSVLDPADGTEENCHQYRKEKWIQDQAEDGAPSPDQAAETADQKRCLLDAIAQCRGSLTAQENQVLDMVYQENLNGAEIGRRLGLTRERIRQIHFKCLKKLRRKLPKVVPNEFSST